MKIEEFISNPKKAYIKAERYLNNGSRSKLKNTTSPKTSPLSDIESFDLIVVKLNDVIIEDVAIDNNFFISSNCIIIHPDLKNNVIFNNCNCEYVSDKITVEPTASGRTTYSLENNIFIKLAYLDILGRIPRHISLEKIQSSFEVTRLLTQIIDNGKTNPSFSILKEDKGRVAYLPQGDKFYELGVLFREGIPYPHKKEFHSLIPFFSLFSKEYKPGSDWELTEIQDEPLVIQLFKKQEKTSLEEFTLNNVIKPLLHTYFDALIYGGIELEAHAQNMLIAIDINYNIIQIVCRDLESAGRDISLMQLLKIPFSDVAKNYKYILNTEKNANDKYSNYQRNHSFMFDFKLGEYIITPLLDCISQYDARINKTDIEKEIKLFNSQFIKMLPDNFFPIEWCDYDDIIWDEKVKKTYNWYEQPKYR